MRKLLLATLFVAAAFSVAPAQDNTPQGQDIPNMGRAPSEPNGIGRLDARVVDEAGNPVRGVHLKLESRRTDGFYCESWNWTDERGVAVLPPLHMGRLRLIVKAKGYEDQRLEISAANLSEPVRVTLVKD
ncbi:MAG TPA: carboxypeptidase-like regulatory domain-containing protein [Pyrinomonadaceae bacterium]|nr:carboxypeptidase-like regulatory domain-containing protein [Pyrinomonadaceae bacterium]